MKEYGRAGGSMEVQHHLFLNLAPDVDKSWAVSLSCCTLMEVSSMDQRFSVDSLD